MWIAAHYDIHGNLPALEAVLGDVHRANASAVAVASPDVDEIVVGGEAVPSPMPRQALERLLELAMPVRFIARESVAVDQSLRRNDGAVDQPTPGPRHSGSTRVCLREARKYTSRKEDRRAIGVLC